MGRYLVTGGAGFIGSHLVERLAASGEEVCVLDSFDDFYDPAVKRAHLAEAMARGKARLVQGDIRDEEALARAFHEGPFDAVFHLAARAGVGPSLRAPLLYQDVNVRGTIAVLEAAARHGGPRTILASSSSVYGDGAPVPFRESETGDRPLSPYAASKRAMELFAYAAHRTHGLPVCCARLFTVYGPRQRPDMSIHIFTKAILAGEVVHLFGDDRRRDFTHVDDICDGLAALARVGFEWDVVNLGESRPVPLESVVEWIARAAGREARIERGPERRGDMRETFAEIARARDRYGYAPKVSVERGIADYVAWYRARLSPA